MRNNNNNNNNNNSPQEERKTGENRGISGKYRNSLAYREWLIIPTMT